MTLRRRVALALVCACALATVAHGAEVVFNPPSGTTRERTLRVRVEAFPVDASSETPAIVYTLNGAKPSTRAGGDTKAYESEIALPCVTSTRLEISRARRRGNGARGVAAATSI
jgi:hypothetical protein